MLLEPQVDRVALLDALRDLYGLAFEGLRFIPVGWVAAGYEVRVGDERYFLKLWPGGRDAAGAVARLPLVLRLHELGFRVPYPVATAGGALSGSVAAGVVALFPFLPGVTPAGWPRWPAAALDELGRMIAALHAATPELSVVLPHERFLIPVADELRLHLSDRAVKPDRGAVMDQLERLEGLQSAVRRLPAQYVVCHADLVGDNILVDDAGRVSAVDWDAAYLAPPELDLAMLLHGEQPTDDQAFRRALAVYPRDVPLSEDLFAFFLLRRYLDDYTARVLRLHQDELDPAEAADAHDGLRRWGSEQWLHLDRTLGLIRGALLENRRIGY
ncbi:MAG: spectinomycin phosphotransferase [Kribbellaceae bacterium]|nr:spectinomycin phosphotransferase [Kribbellaceae bacterium]